MNFYYRPCCGNGYSVDDREDDLITIDDDADALMSTYALWPTNSDAD